MQAPRRGNGADFNPNSEYRMYHGDRVPGFPQVKNILPNTFLLWIIRLLHLLKLKHPHRGFETVTATLKGIIDHTDSCGNAGRYGQGDLQWMTAGTFSKSSFIELEFIISLLLPLILKESYK